MRLMSTGSYPYADCSIIVADCSSKDRKYRKRQERTLHTTGGQAECYNFLIILLKSNKLWPEANLRI
jgi:hypothetical protein